MATYCEGGITDPSLVYRERNKAQRGRVTPQGYTASEGLSWESNLSFSASRVFPLGPTASEC